MQQTWTICPSTMKKMQTKPLDVLQEGQLRKTLNLYKHDVLSEIVIEQIVGIMRQYFSETYDNVIVEFLDESDE